MQSKTKRNPEPPGHLIPPAEMFDRVLPGRIIIDADLSFEERVERAWRRLKSQFHENEHERLQEAIRGLLANQNTL
jgi:hypothetical protein